jgi:hypothetical protein
MGSVTVARASVPIKIKVFSMPMPVIQGVKAKRTTIANPLRMNTTAINASPSI